MLSEQQDLQSVCSLHCAFTVFSNFPTTEHILFALSGKQVFSFKEKQGGLLFCKVKDCVFKMPWNVFQIIIIFLSIEKKERVSSITSKLKQDAKLSIKT